MLPEPSLLTVSVLGMLLPEGIDRLLSTSRMDGWVTVGRICARNVGFGVSFGPIASRLLRRGLGRGLGCGLRLRRRLALRCLGAGRGLVSDPPCRGDLGLHIRG